jgi:hypothetical protein
MGTQQDRYEDRSWPGKVADRPWDGLAAIVAVTLIACLVLVGLSYGLELSPQSDVAIPRPPASYLAK